MWREAIETDPAKKEEQPVYTLMDIGRIERIEEQLRVLEAYQTDGIRQLRSEIAEKIADVKRAIDTTDRVAKMELRQVGLETQQQEFGAWFDELNKQVQDMDAITKAEPGERIVRKVSQSSFEIGTPGKGGKAKIYFDDAADLIRKIDLVKDAAGYWQDWKEPTDSSHQQGT